MTYGDFRTITTPSVCVKHLHSIIANRINRTFKFDPRQRAFRLTNGCADNTTLLDMVLRDRHQRYEPCYIASFDVSKAFDSVSHKAIFGTLKSYGIPEGFVTYAICKTYMVAPQQVWWVTIGLVVTYIRRDE